MSHTKNPLVIANWKMNPASSTEAKMIFTGIKTAAKKFVSVQVVVAPPLLYITELKKLQGTSAITLGAQTMHEAPLGAQTGEVSAPMLVAAGISHVILGHSERRALGETDVMVAKKTIAALKAKLVPVVCVGERERDISGNFFAVIEAQIKAALTGVPTTRFKDVVIAYEPIWAIGTGKTASVEDVCEMQLFIHKVLTKLFDRAAANRVRIVYGGSVNAENAPALYRGAAISGFLVGGASLKPADFTKIIQATV
jgi:triosephosphate isomerase